MAHQSLYRRYRSRNFSEILGQPHITDPLRAAVAEGRHGHAYLFSGPRGTGKTSTARVLAKALNCENIVDGEPCSECQSCLSIESGSSFDLHELDAASNNKVDDMRDLISKVHLGSPGRTKVYILDEVHMLSSGAENALLKTLEEPPEHVVFVLATTEPHKVVPTIRSRTQHFQFHLLGAEELTEHVRRVIDDADLDVDDEAVGYVIRQGGGSARDTLSALDLVAAGGVPDGNDTAEKLTRAIGAADPSEAIQTIQTGLELGLEPRTIGEDCLETLRNAFLSTMGSPLAHLDENTRTVSASLASELGAANVTRALETIGRALVDMRQAPDPRVVLEVAVLGLCRQPDASPGSGSSPVASAVSAPSRDVGPLLARIEQLERQVADLSTKLANLPTVTSAPQTASQPAGNAPTPRRQGQPSPRSGRRKTPSGPAPQAEPQPQASSAPQAGQSQAPPATPPTVEHPPSHTPSAPSPQSGQPLNPAAVNASIGAAIDSLEQRARVRLKVGRVVGVSGDTVQFGLPNKIHRDRAEEVAPELVAALSSALNQPVKVVLVVDTESAAPTDLAKLDPTPPPSSAGPSGDSRSGIPTSNNNQQEQAEAEAAINLDELTDASDATGQGIDRLTKAFPGSEILEA